MKKLLTLTFISLGLFLFTGVVYASATDVLQPASTITYNEDLTVNGTGRFNSVYIGQQGVGGVTFFNGTIINSTTGDNDYDNPVTFGDGVRIDGLIWGGPNKGNVSDQALKIADSLLPGLTDINDLGSSNLKWRDLYLSGGLKTKSLEVEDPIKWQSPRKKYLSLVGSTCTGSGLDYIHGYCSGNNSGIMRAYWSVELPQSAKVTELKGTLKDNYSVAPFDDLRCSLIREKVNTTSVGNDILASISSSGASTQWRLYSDTLIDYAVIDNEKYGYYIECTPGAPIVTDSFIISSLRVGYELLEIN